MEYPVGKYDLDGLLKACAGVEAGALDYIPGIEMDYDPSGGKDYIECVREHILGHDVYAFLLCHELSEGEAFKLADGTEIDPSSYEDEDGPAMNSDRELFGIEIHVESGTIQLEPSLFDLTSAEVFSLEEADDDDEIREKFQGLMLEKIGALIGGFAKKSS
jgi:hypothetical protein